MKATKRKQRVETVVVLQTSCLLSGRNNQRRDKFHSHIKMTGSDQSYDLCDCNASNACILHSFDDIPALPEAVLSTPPPQATIAAQLQLAEQIDLFGTVPETPLPPGDEGDGSEWLHYLDTQKHDHSNDDVVPPPPPPDPQSRQPSIASPQQQSVAIDEDVIDCTQQGRSESDHPEQNANLPTLLAPQPPNETGRTDAHSRALSLGSLRAARHGQEGVAPNLSDEAKALLGEHIPINTKKSTDSALSVFCVFYANRFGLLIQSLLDELNDSRTKSYRRKGLQEQVVKLTRMDLFKGSNGIPEPVGHNDWQEWQLQRINNALIEFVAHHRNNRTGEELSPLTLKSYIAGIQRGFSETFGYKFNLFSGKVFSNKRNGISTVLDNKIRQLQASGVVRRSHNNLSNEDLQKLYKSEVLSMNTPRGFITRILVDIVLMTSFRKSELHALRMKHVTPTLQNGVKAWRIVGTIGAPDGASKTQGGGLAMVNARPKEVLLFDMDMFDGELNLYKDVETYLNIVSKIRGPEDRFFAPVNYRASRRSEFFKKGNLGVNSIAKYLTDACKELGIRGEGVLNHVSAHSFRATVVSQLKAAGYDDASVALRSGHRDLRSLTHYHNLRVDLGRHQQAAIFGQVLKRTSEDIGNDQEGSRQLQAVDSDTVAINEEGRLCHSIRGRASAAKRPKIAESFAAIQNMSGITGNVTVNISYYGISSGPSPGDSLAGATEYLGNGRQ